jgi:hypothetical protein
MKIKSVISILAITNVISCVINAIYYDCITLSHIKINGKEQRNEKSIGSIGLCSIGIRV